MSKILVVDDEPGMRQIIARILNPQGYETIMGEDGAQGLEACRRETVELAIIDIRLPDKEGAEMLASLKKIRPTLPVIVLAGVGDIENAVELVRQGASDYLSKPFKVEELLRMVRKTFTTQQTSAPPEEVPPAWETPAPAPERAREPEQPMPSPSSSPSLSEPIAIPAPALRSLSRKRKKQSFSLPSFPFKAVGIIAAGLAGVVLLGFLGSRMFRSEVKEASFPIPYSNPSAICWDGKNIWTSDWLTEAVYRHKNDDSFYLLTSYKLPGIQPIGLTYDGANLWSCSAFAQKIYRHNLDAQLSVSAEFPSPGASPSGLFFDGVFLWSTDLQQSKVYKHRLDATLSVVETYDSPARNPRSIFLYKKHFYIIDSNENRIVMVRPEDFSVRGIYTLPEYEQDKKMRLVGMACDGKALWTCADSVPKVFRHSMKSLKPVKF